MKHKLGWNQYTDATHCKNGHPFSGVNLYMYPSGRRGCRECDLISKEKHARTHKEEHRLQSQEYKSRNPVKCDKASLVQRCKRAGFTIETRKTKLEEQNNKCAICQREFVSSVDTCMDHEHIDPPKPRGMLCRKHNAALGGFADSIELLEASIAYLRKYGKQ